MAEASLPSDSADRGAPPFERLLEHAAWLRALARHLVDDSAAADDLVQETWLAAVRRPPLETRPLQPWLAGVARRLAAFTRRGDGRRQRREREQPVLGSAPSTDELVARAELQRRLVERVLALREPSRSTVLLCYFEGLAPSEAARAIGVPAATVRTRLKRALDELREQFDSERRDGGVDWRGAFAVFAARAGGGAAKAVVVKAMAAIVVAAAGFVAWKSFERAPRESAPPVRVATAASEERKQAELAAGAELPPPARVPESPAAAKPANVATSAAAPDAGAAEDEPETMPVIRGRVLLPDGSPVTSCNVVCNVVCTYPPAPGHGLLAMTYSSGVTGGVTGEFEFQLNNPDTAPDKRVRIVARAKVEGRSMCRFVDLRPVSRNGLDIVLADSPKLHVRVLDEQREVVESFRCIVPDTFGSTRGEDWTEAQFVKSMTTPQYLHLRGGQIELHPEGRCDVDLPLDRYVVVIDAPGFERGVAGPFAVAPLTDPPSRDVEVVLKRRTTIAGHVVAAGRPVEGALVAVHAIPPEDRHFVMEDLVVDVDPWNGQRVTTDAHGSFVLPFIEAPFGAKLFVLATGFARSEVTLGADRLDRSSDLAVELHPGGTLVGTLTGLESMISAGLTERIQSLLILAERHDLWPRTVHVDAQGRFRIEHLSPGRWKVSMPSNGSRFEGIDLGNAINGGRVNDPVPPLDWNVEIREGAESTITFDAFTGPTSR